MTFQCSSLCLNLSFCIQFCFNHVLQLLIAFNERCSHKTLNTKSPSTNEPFHEIMPLSVLRKRILNKHACAAIQPGCLSFGRTLRPFPYFMCANSEGPGEAGLPVSSLIAYVIRPMFPPTCRKNKIGSVGRIFLFFFYFCLIFVC